MEKGKGEGEGKGEGRKGWRRWCLGKGVWRGLLFVFWEGGGEGCCVLGREVWWGEGGKGREGGFVGEVGVGDRDPGCVWVRNLEVLVRAQGE